MDAHALCSSYPYTFVNGQTADANQVNANFNCAALTSSPTIATATLTTPTISSPTMTGTVTGPDNGTWTSSELLVNSQISINSIYTVGTGNFLNVSGAQTITVAVGTAGELTIVADQNGIGTQTAKYAYLYTLAGVLTVSSAQYNMGNTVLSSVTAGAGVITLTPVSSNTYINYVKTTIPAP